MSVWETLSKIDVSSKIEKKGNLSYLSWAWAWGTLKSHYPESHYAFRDTVFLPDGTVEVWVDMTVVDGEKSQTHEMWLPVMDNRNNAIQNPDARKISDTRMRCLVKAIAMFGLGHYIYAGEDLPGSEPEGQSKPVSTSNTQDQGDDKPWYNDFEDHRQLMIDRMKDGENPDDIIKKLRQKFKVSRETADKIKALQSEAVPH